ncbi:lipase family protein [Mucilaginibacter sp. X4EP1]|uniref:lipase family protein n=1 Tax=Mucilaginibacter sp. X4EP1 TaxID=2723092 RepID=UPI00216785C0|nr:hypothetical protein [Mucilaginibacter sp. X4EP1]MCS3812195.1 hypothetical protein [Mucilaginibacter sp. X4EP1]
MSTTELINSNYNYYPNTMIALCSASYLEDTTDVNNAVEALGLEVVWGPIWLSDWIGISYSMMYVAANASTGEYTVVIRGTNAISLSSWLEEDFDVEYTEPFTDFVPNAPAEAMLSQASYNGLSDLLSMVDPVNGSLTEFIANATYSNLYVTGHSLGGTLTPAMFAYLNYITNGGKWVVNMACWSFAGLTSGNNFFAEYWNSLSNPQFAWRIHNPLDIAPFLFYSQTDVQNIYDAYGFPWTSLNLPLRTMIDTLFYLAEGNDYTQPVGDQQLAAIFSLNFDAWDEQAFYQHHVSTYLGLVKQFYPI